MKHLIQELKKHRLIQDFSDQKVSFSHLSLTQEALLIASSYLNKPRPMVVVKANLYLAQQLFEKIQFWLDEIRKTVDTVYNEYITGKCETYLLDGDEMKQTFKTAHGLYIDETLIGMLDKGLLSLSVGEDGEILYSLSDEGKDLGELMFGKAKLN